MKALFCYDGPLTKDIYGNYYGIALNEQMFARYYNIVDSLAVAIRVQSVTDMTILKKLSKIELKNFGVVNLPDLWSLKSIFANFKKTKAVLNEEITKADLVIVRLPSLVGSLSIKIARKLNKPYLIEVVGCPWDSLWNHSVKGKLAAPFMCLLTKKTIKNAPYALYVSEKFLQKRYPCRGKSVACSDVMLPPGNNNDILAGRLKKIQNLKNGQLIVLGTTGALNVKYKGQQYVIRAIALLNQQGFNFEYRLAGGGDNTYLKAVAAKWGVQDKVKFLGSLPHEKVFQYLDDIDIYIQPSVSEGLPRALIEAMSRACPCLGAQAGGIPELLSGESIFAKAKVQEICYKLRSIKQATLQAEAKRNFQKAQTFDQELLTERRKAFYEEFVNLNKNQVLGA